MEISKNYLDKFFGQEDPGIVGELVQAITEKVFTLRHIGDINNRVIHNWIAEGLVPGFKVTPIKKKGKKSNKKPQKWNRFSYLDYIWLRIVIELRKFDVSFSQLQKIKNELYTIIDIDAYLEMLKNKIDQLDKILTPEQMDEFHAMLSNPDKDKDFLDVHSQMSYLFFLLANVIIRKEAISLIINNEGKVFPYSIIAAEEFMEDKEYVEAISDHHISISLSKIVAEFITNSKELSNDVLRLKLLTVQEIRIINLIRTEKIKELKIRYDEMSNPVMIELTTNNRVSLDTKIIDIIYQKGYHSIALETAAGKVVHCSNTRKIKL